MIELRNINVLINTMTNKKLTVIMPIRENKDIDILERLQYSLEDDYLDYKRVNLLVVDDGSSREFLDDLYNFCVLNSFSLIHLDTRLEPFSIARARNIGAMYAQSTYIMFLDVDLVTYNGFYNDILSEIEIQQLYQYANDFIMVGVIYLTKEASIEYFNINKKIRKNFVIQKLLENDESF
ncbi:MAG TPA: glycosyltransferase, partial [Crocinitomix sp.]|nr:glycosyltransferase [Crocinitomix sp.]